MESILSAIVLEKEKEAAEILETAEDSTPEPQISGYSIWYAPPDEQELVSIKKAIDECQKSAGAVIKKSGSMSGFKSWIDFSDSTSLEREDSVDKSDSPQSSLEADSSQTSMDGLGKTKTKSSKKRKIKTFFTKSSATWLVKNYSPQSSMEGVDETHHNPSEEDNSNVHILEDEVIHETDSKSNYNQLPHSEESVNDSQSMRNVKPENDVLQEPDRNSFDDGPIDCIDNASLEKDKQVPYPDWSIFPNGAQCHSSSVEADTINKHEILKKSNSDPKSATEDSEYVKKKKPSKKYHTIDSDSLESTLVSEKSFLSSHVNTFPGSIRDYLTSDATKQDPLADLVKSHVTHVSCYGPEKYKIEAEGSGDGGESLVQNSAVWYIEMEPWEILYFSQEYDNIEDIESCKDVIIHGIV